MITAAAAGDSFDINLLLGKRPLPTQLAFLRSPAKFKDYQGPFGSGKTEVLIWQALILSVRIPNNRGLIGRYSYNELRDTTRKRFIELTPPALIKSASIPERGDGYIEWVMGGETLFRNLDNEQKYGSLSIGYFGLDEGSECPEKVWNYLEGRVGRHWNDLGIPAHQHPYSPGFTVGNPGGRDWRWKRFHNPVRSADLKELYRGFTPQARENEANLPAGYYDRLARGKPAWWVGRYILGKMGALQGLVWPVWDDALHLVKPFPINRNWSRRTGHDHGRANPTACLWCAIDFDGNLIFYREYELAGPTIREHVRHIMREEQRAHEAPERRIADPSMFNRMVSVDKGGQAGDKWHSVSQEYEDCGLSPGLEPGDNAMAASLERCAMLLWPDPSHKFPAWHPRAGQHGSPRVFFFDTLERTAECCSKWKFKEPTDADVQPQTEKPVDIEDHLPDCFRYVAMSFPEASVDERAKPEPTHRDWQIERKKAIGRQIRREVREEQERDDLDIEYEDIDG